MMFRFTYQLPALALATSTSQTSFSDNPLPLCRCSELILKYQHSQQKLKETQDQLLSLQHCVDGLKEEVETLHQVRGGANGELVHAPGEPNLADYSSQWRI